MKRLGIGGIVVSLAAGGVVALSACLEGDTRPPPAVIHFQVEPSEAVTSGVTTADGWTITFERLLVGALGDAQISGYACNPYVSNPYDGYPYKQEHTGYQRLFDFTVAGRQKVADVYGLGTCDARMKLSQPLLFNTLLGAGVTDDDLAMMLERGTDPWTEWDAPTIVYALGKAARGDVEKQFEWKFRLSVTLQGVCGYLTCEYCPIADDVGRTRELSLIGGQDLPLVFTIHGEELFRESLELGAALRFSPMADADTDGDQRVTLDELAKVPGPAPPSDAGAPDADSDAGSPSLGDFVYLTLVPSMVRIDGNAASCPRL